MGQRVKISYDPHDRDKFQLVSETPAATAAALSSFAPGGVPSGAMASLAAITRAASTQAAASSAPAGAPPLGRFQTIGGAQKRDPLDRLKKLMELRDGGALTPAEFEAQKAKILAET